MDEQIVYIVCVDEDDAIIEELKSKPERLNELVAEMRDIVRECDLSDGVLRQALKRTWRSTSTPADDRSG